jgi:hypothetical protein
LFAEKLNDHFGLPEWFYAGAEKKSPAGVPGGGINQVEIYDWLMNP